MTHHEGVKYQKCPETHFKNYFDVSDDSVSYIKLEIFQIKGFDSNERSSAPELFLDIIRKTV